MAEETITTPANVEAPTAPTPAKTLLVLHPHLCLCLVEPGKRVTFHACPRTGQCPCGLEVSDPRNAANLFRQEIIHFDPPTKFAGRSVGAAACDSKLKSPTLGLLFTGEVNAVTCLGCKASQVFTDQQAKNGFPSVPSEVDKAWIEPVKQ